MSDMTVVREPGMMYFPIEWGAKEPQNPKKSQGITHLLTIY